MPLKGHMHLIDSALIAFGILISITMYSGVIISDHPRARSYLRENMGAPFIIAFVVLLLSAAIMFSLPKNRQARWITLILFEAL